MAARDLERLGRLACPLMILDDAHGWYLDTVGLTQDVLAVLAAVPSSPDRAGDLLAALAGSDRGDLSPAAAWYERAIDRAGQLGARMALLRATCRLARLGRATGESRASTDRLRSVHETFTEGLETADLVEARDLLAALEGGGQSQAGAHSASGPS